jgi:hypothetical protein
MQTMLNSSKFSQTMTSDATAGESMNHQIPGCDTDIVVAVRDVDCAAEDDASTFAATSNPKLTTSLAMKLNVQHSCEALMAKTKMMKKIVLVAVVVVE